MAEGARPWGKGSGRSAGPWASETSFSPFRNDQQHNLLSRREPGFAEGGDDPYRDKVTGKTRGCQYEEPEDLKVTPFDAAGLHTICNCKGNMIHINMVR